MDNDENKKRSLNTAANIITWILPSAVIIAVMLFMNVIPDLFSAGSFVFALGLGLIISRIIFVIRSRRSLSEKIWRLILWVFLLVFMGFIFLLMPKTTHECTTDDAQSKFESVVSEKYPGVYDLPLNLGSPSSVEYHTYTSFAVIFESRSYTLLCSYDESSFYDEAAVLESEYATRSEPFESVGDYVFFLVTTGDEDLPFFKKSAYLIINNKDHEIGFMIFDDIDLDVADDRTDFLNSYCGWEYIR